MKGHHGIVVLRFEDSRSVAFCHFHTRRSGCRVGERTAEIVQVVIGNIVVMMRRGGGMAHDHDIVTIVVIVVTVGDVTSVIASRAGVIAIGDREFQCATHQFHPT
jgi:hypothetical protein